MKLQSTYQYILLFLLKVLAAPINGKGYDDVKTAARVARTLVYRESLTSLNTVDRISKYPVSFVEYYSDCDDDGQPVMLMISVSSSNKNIEAGSLTSLSIRVGDHPLNEHVNMQYPGGTHSSTAGLPRINLKGKFIEVNSTEDILKYEFSFGKRHKDSIKWYPGSPIHESRWVKFKVEHIYMVGGFGNLAYIGEIGLEEYLNAEIIKDFEWTSLLNLEQEQKHLIV